MLADHHRDLGADPHPRSLTVFDVLPALKDREDVNAREADALRYYTAGRSPHAIAAALRSTETAVRATLARARRALGAATLAEAIQIHNTPTESTP